MKLPRFWFPKSLVARTLGLTVLAIVVAQGIATTIWYYDSKNKEIEGIRSASESMANMFASTANFFQSLPVGFRHIVLDQIRDMGGTRFFVSFNKEALIVEPIPDTRLKKASMSAVRSVLLDKLPKAKQVLVDFSQPDKLRLLRNDLFLDDLPKSWAHHTLTLNPIDPPVMVAQIELNTGEWLYVAALLPAPYLTLDDRLLNREQWMYLLISTSILLALTYFLMRRQVKPLKRLANAANAVSMDIEQAPLEEEGAEELVTATRAFNRMQQRIHRYVSDREQLFSSISHDLKTPITRLRLRSEMLQNEVKREKFNQDLDDLELMVKGALQCVRETELHENNAYIDLVGMVMTIIEPINQQTTRLELIANDIPSIVAKPLAIKRVLSNVIDNAVQYGERATITLESTQSCVIVSVLDNGPGIPEHKLEQVFEPYFRLSNDGKGHGLGLGISRNIMHGHGGDLILSNQAGAGLKVEILIPTALEV